ncbi:hypothetical protein [Halomonas sp. NO4]|uniref:hypothetical protein n=1 Tax=Halomonas sp. NO4 TaxID=2484813 RepID=UPI0013D611A5|nr:hypothetical protein [Halomonas sp. NO4]
MAYAGIVNDNEFYSEHYLADIFEGDVRGVLEAWQQRATEHGETPWALLRRGAHERLREIEAVHALARWGRIILTPSKRLVGVGLPRKANKKDLDNDIHYSIDSPDRTAYGIALGWEEIKDLQEGVVRKTYLDDTLPDGPWEKTVEYHAPFTRPDREKDYEEAWAYFERASS